MTEIPGDGQSVVSTRGAEVNGGNKENVCLHPEHLLGDCRSRHHLTLDRGRVHACTPTHIRPHSFYKGLYTHPSPLILQGSTRSTRIFTHTYTPLFILQGSLHTHHTHTHISTHSKGSLQKTPGDLFRFPVRFLYKHCWLAKLWAERSLPSVRPEGHWRGAEEDKSRSPWTVGSGPFQPPLFLAVCLHSRCVSCAGNRARDRFCGTSDPGHFYLGFE